MACKQLLRLRTRAVAAEVAAIRAVVTPAKAAVVKAEAAGAEAARVATVMAAVKRAVGRVAAVVKEVAPEDFRPTQGPYRVPAVVVEAEVAIKTTFPAIARAFFCSSFQLASAYRSSISDASNSSFRARLLTDRV